MMFVDNPIPFKTSSSVVPCDGLSSGSTPTGASVPTEMDQSNMAFRVIHLRNKLDNGTDATLLIIEYKCG